MAKNATTVSMCGGKTDGHVGQIAAICHKRREFSPARNWSSSLRRVLPASAGRSTRVELYPPSQFARVLASHGGQRVRLNQREGRGGVAGGNRVYVAKTIQCHLLGMNGRRSPATCGALGSDGAFSCAVTFGQLCCKLLHDIRPLVQLLSRSLALRLSQLGPHADVDAQLQLNAVATDRKTGSDSNGSTKVKVDGWCN